MRVVLLCGLTIYILLSGLLSKCTNSSKITERRNMSGAGGGGEYHILECYIASNCFQDVVDSI